jgi:SAM-dependent MidA family methyltransferase
MTTTTLQQLIVERILREGPLTFAEYMRMALYEPGYGYYVTGPAKMGWEGDYYTSTDVSALFAHCVGRQLMQMWEQLGRPDPFTVLEQGAGRGHLAHQMRSWAAQEAPAFEAALVYHTMDIHSGNDALNAHTTTSTQAGLVGSEMGASSISTALDSSPRQPDVILANELVDAFPVHVVEKHGDRLYEICVDIQRGRHSDTETGLAPEINNDVGTGLVPVLSEIDNEDVASYLDHYKIPWHTYEDGWRAEINLDARRWIEQVAQLFVGPRSKRRRHGFLLTIDYGDTARKLYTPYRRYGTLASYFRHQFTEQPLARPGEQDLTAHVNFTALIQAGRHYGLRLDMLTTQRQWLTDLQIYEELERVRKDKFSILDEALASDEGQIALLKWYNLRQGVMALTARGGMGDFKVLILKR